VVEDVNALITLKPGEYRIFTTKKLATPEVPVAVNEKMALKDELMFYPNPVEDLLMISGKSIISEIRIADIQGRIVKTVNPDSESLTIDLSGVAPGIYFMQVNQGNSIVTGKVVKK